MTAATVPTPAEVAAAVERLRRFGEWPTDPRVLDVVRGELDDDARPLEFAAEPPDSSTAEFHALGGNSGSARNTTSRA